MPRFGLVYNNKVVVGPREFMYLPFKNFCEETGLDFSVIPKTKIDELPIVGTGYKILPITKTTTPPNDKFQQLSGPTLTIKTDNIEEVFGVVDKPLASCKSEMKAELATNRYNKEVSDISLKIQNTDVIVEADRTNKMMIIQIYSVMPDNQVYNFKFPKSNNWLALTKSDMGIIVNAIMDQTQTAFNWETTVSGLIDKCTTIAGLKVIDIVGA